MPNDSCLAVIPAEALAGVGMPAFPPFPAEMMVAGTSEHQAVHAYTGGIGVGVYQAKPATIALADYPKDELMYVLDGKVTVTEEGRPPVSFLPGQAFVLRQGFRGTFEMIGNFRKLAVAAGEASAAKVDWLSKGEQNPEAGPGRG